MKNYLQLVSLIFIGIALYVVYGFLTFVPDENAPFIFHEPTLPPEIAAEIAAEGAELSTEDQLTQSKAIEEAQKALSLYSRYESAAGEEVKDTLTVLVSRMQNWEMPAYLLSQPDSNGQRKFETLRIDSSKVVKYDPAQPSQDLTCDSGLTTGAIVGSTGKDMMECGVDRLGKTTANDIIFIGGPDADTITDGSGNRIVNAGTGNDAITLGAGRSVLILDAAWGKDNVTVDCTGAKVEKDKIPQGFAVPWIHPFNNFIVLGTGVDPRNLIWKGNVLTDITTGDTLTVTENCFSVVPLSDVVRATDITPRQ